jgi:RNA polymerase primary sigma factor
VPLVPGLRRVYHGRVKHSSRDETADARTLQAYLQEISRIPRVTAHEEHELGGRIQRDGDEAALKRLVEANLRFVVSYAKRYRNLGVGFLDLIHEGNLGLLQAARRFDPARNVKFITYAVWWIRQAIMHALSDQRRAFALPAKLSAVASRYGQEVSDLTARLDHAPTREEIAADLDISAAEAEALQFVAGNDVSLSDPVGQGDDDNRELGETLPQHMVPPVEDELLHEALLSQLAAALAELEPKEREVMRRRFGLAGREPQTLQEIGDELRLSRERVRQIEARAKEKLRRGRKAGELRSYLN